jgi:dipeptidyl aminopeptidase/acylaminoacyl peptidase
MGGFSMKLDVLLFSLVALLAPPAAAQQTAKISAPLAPEVRSGRVSEFLFTHDGTRVVYRDDRVQAFRFELFSRPLDGSAPSVRLNGPLHPQGSVGVSNYTGSFAVGAQDRVVYWADEVADDVSELYLVPADGSASRIRISAPGESVGFVRLDPAGTRAFYQDGSYEGPFGPLRVVPLDLSAPPLVLSSADVRRFWLSPDGATLVFAATVPAASHRQDLFVMPSDGSAPPLFLTRTQPFPIGIAWIDDLVFTADGLRVVYNEHDYDFDDNHLYTTFSLTLDGSAPLTQLVGSNQYQGVFRLVPDAVPERVVFVALGRLDSKTTTGALATTLSPPGATIHAATPLVVGADVVFSALDGSASIFRVPADGSLPATALCAGGSGFAMALASPTTVAFSDTRPSGYRLHTVPLAGGTALPLHPQPPPSQGTHRIFPHPDGQRVLYVADMDVVSRYELYVVPLDASQPPLKLSPPLDAGYVWNAQLTPDATQVVFLAGPANGGPNELYVAPVDGSAPAFHLNEPVASGNILGDVTSFQLTPDATGLVYRADLDADENFDLVSVDAHGVGRRLGDGAGSVLTGYALTPDSTRAVFQTLVGSEHALRVAGLADGAALTLDEDVRGFPEPFRFQAGRVVYRRAVTSSTDELRSAALDGLSPPVVLHGPLASFASVGEFRAGAAGVVVFVADLVTDGAAEVWAAPLAGGAPPVRLSPALVTGGSVTSVELDASGTWAVFLADAHVNNRFELYSAPVDGSRPARRLDGALLPLGDVTEFALTPDGERVVYRADQLADGRFDLFSVPLRGSPPRHARPGGTAPTRTLLLSALPPGRAVQPDWRLSPDGTQVVYRANATDVLVLELLRAPIDGSTPPVALSGALPTTADVAAFRIAPDQSRVAFVADSRLDLVMEPFSVPFAGGTVVPLAQLPSFAAVSELRIEASSHDLVYTAAAQSPAQIELYRVPLDGSAPARRLNPTPTLGGDVLTDFLPLPVGVVYRADQQRDDVFELYVSF